MKKNNMRDFSTEELYLVKGFIETHNDKITMLSEVDKMILEKEEKVHNMNHRLTIELMEELHFFDSEMFEILKSHNIKNIQNLINSNLDEWNLTNQRRLELEEAKVWYDFSHLEENIEKVKKKRK